MADAPEEIGVKLTEGYEFNWWGVVTDASDEEAVVYVREDTSKLDRSPSWHRIDDPDNPPPMDGTEVLGLMGAKDARLVWYFASSSQTKRWLDVNGKEVQPTHWMHLPQPPKEGE
ncbi:DUF551 domain-containing protein [Pseudophaeobacter sp. 1A09344]|uniref:DUF551 domain-containing protein n=1 Tax=Pseudophaeobacter sp. 1A09344 TaxID=3098144 RepID=UPI0034D65BCD